MNSYLNVNNNNIMTDLKFMQNNNTMQMLQGKSKKLQEENKISLGKINV